MRRRGLRNGNPAQSPELRAGGVGVTQSVKIKVLNKEDQLDIYEAIQECDKQTKSTSCEADPGPTAFVEDIEWIQRELAPQR